MLPLSDDGTVPFELGTLNGWQRLWVVFTGLWLGVYGVAGIDVGVPSYVHLAMAVVPPVLLYVAGLTVVWIRRGFRG